MTGSPQQVDFPLSRDSVVFDVGGYRGAWTEDLIERLGFCPEVHVFEPIAEYSFDIPKRERVEVHPFALGAIDKEDLFIEAGDASGVFPDSGITVKVNVRDIYGVFQELGIYTLDLISINCEGGEYDILDRMIRTGLISRCKYIQIQFHDLFPEASDRRRDIRHSLTASHKERYCKPWVWEAWERCVL